MCNFVDMANPILLYTAIDDKKVEEMTNQIFDTPENEAIEIWINTPGGSVSAGWSLLAALNEKKNKVNETVVGDASSFGFYMLLFADHVRAYDTSNFLIHRAASMWEDLMNESELKEIEARNTVIRTKLESRIIEAKFTEVTGKTFDDIFSMEGQLDVSINAQQAKEIGLIDEIITLDTKKRAEIESIYYNSIAALSMPATNSNNSNKNKMGNKLREFFSSDKEPVLIAKIGETTFVYNKIEVGAKVKATGKDAKSITGTFKAEDKVVAVENDEIVSIDEPKAIEPDVMEALDAINQLIASINERLDDLEGGDESEDMPEAKKDEEMDALKAEVSAMKKTLIDAKLNVSKPKLPEGDFKGNEMTNIKPTAYQVQKLIDAKAKEKQALRDKQNKGRI